MARGSGHDAGGMGMPLPSPDYYGSIVAAKNAPGLSPPVGSPPRTLAMPVEHAVRSAMDPEPSGEDSGTEEMYRLPRVEP